MADRGGLPIKAENRDSICLNRANSFRSLLCLFFDTTWVAVVVLVVVVLVVAPLVVVAVARQRLQRLGRRRQRLSPSPPLLLMLPPPKPLLPLLLPPLPDLASSALWLPLYVDCYDSIQGQGRPFKTYR